MSQDTLSGRKVRPGAFSLNRSTVIIFHFSSSKSVAEVARLRLILPKESPNSGELGYGNTSKFGTTDIGFRYHGCPFGALRILMASATCAVDKLSPPETKVALFRSFFRGRTDVYPRRFENHRTGKFGYISIVPRPRRDRRKDLLLQENGYFVLRFLAEDVGRHLDTVLDAIMRALAQRRGR
jgi:hypothetical protein